MLGYVYGPGKFTLHDSQLVYSYLSTGGALNTNQSLGVKVATPVGNLFGQLFFGWMADLVGRKRMCEYLLWK